MASALLSTSLASPLSFAWLALIIPILILYLLKPKPRQIRFPTTMFLRYIEKNKRFTSFLQRFVRDPILLIQLLIIALITLALVNPFYLSKETVKEPEAVVFVLDISASMMATDAKPTRIGLAKQKMIEIMSELNPESRYSIVLAGSIPTTVLSQGNRDVARDILERVEAAETATNIADAILLSTDIISSSSSKRSVYVLSDFASETGEVSLLAKKMAETRGVDVRLIRVGFRGENAAIVAIDARRSSVNDDELLISTTIKNYKNAEYTTNLKVFSNDKLIDEQLKKIAGDSEELIYIQLNISAEAQKIRLELSTEDDLSVDDKAYSFIPSKTLPKLLLLTTEGSDKYLRYLFDSLVSSKKISYDYAIPPVTPKMHGYNMYVLGNTKPNSILPGTFEEIGVQVAQGATLVVLATDGLWQVKSPGLWDIMPVDMKTYSDRQTEVQVINEHNMLNDVLFDSVVVKKYYNMEERDNLTETIVGASVAENPLISYRPQGKGYVVYMGINSAPDFSNLYYSSSFPIFWSQMIDYFSKKNKEFSKKSYRTGEYLQLDGVKDIRRPDGKYLNLASLYCDKTGFYEISHEGETEIIAVNLANELESDLMGQDIKDITYIQDFKVESAIIDVKNELFKFILLLFLAAIFIETMMYRRRGLI